MSALRPAEARELAWVAGLELPRTAPPDPAVRRRLTEKGLTYNSGGATPAGRAAVLLGGQALTRRQQTLIIALAKGTVRSSNGWHLGGEFSRAPAAALRRLEEIGVARGRLHGGTRMYDATSLGHQVATILRQRPLPPPVGPEGGVRQ